MVIYLYADDGGRTQSPVSEPRRSGMVAYLYADDGGRMQSLVSEPRRSGCRPPLNEAANP